MQVILNSKQHTDWLGLARQALHYQGIVVLQGLLDAGLLVDTRNALEAAQKSYYAEMGEDRTLEAKQQGDVDIRMPMKYHPQFFHLMEHPALLTLVDSWLGNNAILRFVNGFIQPSLDAALPVAPYRQSHFHMNLKQVFNGFPVGLDVIFVVDAGTQGMLFDIVTGSHQRMAMPTESYLNWAAQSIRLPTGSLVVMDPTLWHRERPNFDGVHWMSVQYEFVHPFLKPHIDYLRALGAQRLEGLPESTRRLLGGKAQVPASLDEFYRPADQRLYQAKWKIGMTVPWNKSKRE